MQTPPKLSLITQNNVSQDDFYKYVRVDSDIELNSDRNYRSTIASNDSDNDSRLENYQKYNLSDLRTTTRDGQASHYSKTRVEEIDSLNSIPAIVDMEGTDQKDPKSPNSTEFKKYKVSSTIFLIISILSAILVLACEVYIYTVINVHKKKLPSDTKYEELSIYLALFIFASIFQVFITIVGLRTKNMLLLLTLCLFYACMLIYTGIQYQEVNKFVDVVLVGRWKTATRAVNIITIAIIAITMVLQIYLILVPLNKYVNWFRFKTIGGDVHIRRLYRLFQVHRSLLFFGFFFFLGFTIQFLIIMIRDKSSTEFILTIIVIPITIILLVTSDLAIAKEILSLSIICLIFYIGGVVYILFKMIRLFTKYTSAYHLSLKPGDYFPGRNSLITFAVIALIFIISILGIEIVLMMNFKKGLKPIVQDSSYFIFGRKKKLVEKDNDDISIG